ncbi:hypothetical protein NDU88_006708 [Pleurodeles waltl]|uniref:Uncharacterized protein n=1 Tax=Pleurodeles waltl TaxID=8319 RepID=A0AAV7TYJ4_PLEWA|nr:hypothetical protein NDU88_006708 [Pleurodeles waltl]
MVITAGQDSGGQTHTFRQKERAHFPMGPPLIDSHTPDRESGGKKDWYAVVSRLNPWHQAAPATVLSASALYGSGPVPSALQLCWSAAQQYSKAGCCDLRSPRVSWLAVGLEGESGEMMGVSSGVTRPGL